MSQLNKNRGVLLFCFNNNRIDYTKMACYCAKQIKNHTGLDVVIVTDEPIPGHHTIVVGKPRSTERFYPDFKESMPFLNGGRCMAYDLSPFDETIVVDTDYIVQSNTLAKLSAGEYGLKVAKRTWMINDPHITSDMKTLGPGGLDVWWATLMCFSRTEISKAFFLTWKQIVEDYQFYVDSLRFESTLVRNDFAVTLSLYKIFNGDIPRGIELPYTLPTLVSQFKLSSLEPLEFLDGTDVIGLPFIDVHVMNKQSLMERLDAQR